MEELNEKNAFWIRTEPSIDGETYIVTLSIDEDRAFTLTPTRATAYANALLGAVADAEYDHAVFRLSVERLELATEVALQLVVDLRKERVLRQAAGLTFVSGLSQRNKQPFIHVFKDEEVIGQLSPARARRHALHVLEAVPVADLDASLYRILRSLFGVEEGTARGMIDDLGNWRLDPLIEIDT